MSIPTPQPVFILSDGTGITGEKVVRAVVALKTDDLPDSEREVLETHPNDVGKLRAFLEKMFDGKGTCRAVGDPKLRTN